MLLFSTLQKVVHKDNNHIIITAGKTASQVFKAWELEPVKLFKDTEFTQAEIENKFQQGCNIDFIIRHPAERYISGIKELVLNHSLIDLGNLLRRETHTNIADVIELDTMLAYWHTAEAWEYALKQVFEFWQISPYGKKDFSFNDDYHVGNWLGIIESFIEIAERQNLTNLRIVEVNDIGYYGAKEFDVVFPAHHVSPISAHVNQMITNVLSGIEGFEGFIIPEQEKYFKLLNSKYFYNIKNNHPRNTYYENKF